MASNENGQRAVHEALKEYLDEGEIPICWTLTIDIAGPEGTRYLAHRAGGGLDGTDTPMIWTAVGLLKAGLRVAENQLDDITYTPDEDGDEDDDP